MNIYFSVNWPLGLYNPHKAIQSLLVWGLQTHPSLGFRVRDWVWDLGFGINGLGIGFRVEGLGFGF